MARWLEIAAGVLGLVAAALWIWPAYTRIPSSVTYWSGPPPDDPREIALRFAWALNGYAALFTGLAALCASIRALWF